MAMSKGLWGKKIGMTQIFENDKAIPVTAIEVSNWVVTNIRTKKRDGYAAIQIGCVKKRHNDKTFSQDWIKKPKEYFSFVREVKFDDDVQDITIGQSADFLSSFEKGDKVDITGKTIGRGFAGVVKRHNFGGPPGSHGSTMGRRPGSIGFFTSQGKVIKGKKMPGQLGNKQHMIRNLEVVKKMEDSQLLLVKGAIPGKSGSLVFIRKA
jgi:large subunit ribosomal protein L3